jgi:hypothetical protein
MDISEININQSQNLVIGRPVACQRACSRFISIPPNRLNGNMTDKLQRAKTAALSFLADHGRR